MGFKLQVLVGTETSASKHHQKSRNCFRAVPKIWFFSILSTLKRTVLERGRHSPTVAMSPSLTSKAGEQCTATLLCLFSKRLNFFDVMEVVPPDDNCALHLRRNHHAFQDFSTDADIPGEGAFLVDIVSLFGLLWRRETHANITPVTKALSAFLAQLLLSTKGDAVLPLESPLGLIHGSTCTQNLLACFPL